MKIVSTQSNDQSLASLLAETAASHEPIQIVGDGSNGILVSEEDWRAIQETLYLLSIPGMRESIRQRMSEPIDACSRKIEWSSAE